MLFFVNKFSAKNFRTPNNRELVNYNPASQVFKKLQRSEQYALINNASKSRSAEGCYKALTRLKGVVCERFHVKNIPFHRQI